MRGSAMAFGAFFVLTVGCLLEVLSGNTATPFLVGALIGSIATIGYGGSVYNRIAMGSAPAEKTRAKRSLKRFR